MAGHAMHDQAEHLGPWLVLAFVAVLGMILHAFAVSAWAIAGMVALIAVGTAGMAYSAWATSAHRSSVARWHGVTTMVLIGGWLALCTVTGVLTTGSGFLNLDWVPFTTATFLVLGPAVAAAWNYRMNVHTTELRETAARNTTEPEPNDWEDAVGGKAKITVKEKRINAYRSEGTATIRGTTVEALQSAARRIEVESGWPHGSLTLHPHPGFNSSRKVGYTVMHADPLATPQPWPGLSIKRNQTPFDAVDRGLRADGEVSQLVIARPSGALHSLVVGMNGAGKALKTDTLVPTPHGWTRMGDLRVGDQVFGSDGHPCGVTGAFDIMYGRPCYDVVFSDGSVITCDAEHLWMTETSAVRRSQEQFRRHDAQRIRKPRLDPACYPKLAELVRTNPVAVTVPEVAAAAGIHPTSQILYRIARSLTPLGHIRNLASPMRYGDRIVLKATRPAALYSTEEFLATLIAVGAQSWHDQRDKRPAAEVRSTTDIAATTRDGQGNANHSIPLAQPLSLPNADLPLDPYLLGVWLGDGTTTGGRLTLNRDDAPSIITRIERTGWATRLIPSEDKPGCVGVRVPGLTTVLRAVGVLGNKHVPAAYLRGSIQQRSALLAGLLDTDGTVAPAGATQFDSTLHHLALTTRELAVSLGHRATITSGPARLNGVDHGTVWTVAWTSPDSPFTVPRKRDMLTRRAKRSERHRNDRRYITEVHPVPSVPVRCIRVDSPDNLFLAGESMIPTHNTNGETPTILTCAEIGVHNILIDTSGKALQSYGDIAGAFQMFITTDGMATAFMERLLSHTIRERSAVLAAEGLKSWAPKSRLGFLRIQIEELSFLDDLGLVVDLAKLLRSVGIQLVVSLQRCTFDQMPTTLRDQLGTIIHYGIKTKGDAKYALPEDLVDAGAEPSKWGNDCPGKHYASQAGIPFDKQLLAVRAWADPGDPDVGGDPHSPHGFARTASGLVLPPMCEVTAKSLGAIWDNHTPPVEMVRRALAPVEPVLASTPPPGRVVVAGPRPYEPETGDDDMETTEDVVDGAALEYSPDGAQFIRPGGEVVDLGGPNPDPSITPNPWGDLPEFQPDQHARRIGETSDPDAVPRQEYERQMRAKLAELIARDDVITASDFIPVHQACKWSRPSIYDWLDIFEKGNLIKKLHTGKGWIPVRRDGM